MIYIEKNVVKNRRTSKPMYTIESIPNSRFKLKVNSQIMTSDCPLINKLIWHIINIFFPFTSSILIQLTRYIILKKTELVKSNKVLFICECINLPTYCQFQQRLYYKQDSTKKDFTKTGSKFKLCIIDQSKDYV